MVVVVVAMVMVVMVGVCGDSVHAALCHPLWKHIQLMLCTYTVKYLVSAHYHVNAHPPLLD